MADVDDAGGVGGRGGGDDDDDEKDDDDVMDEEEEEEEEEDDAGAGLCAIDVNTRLVFSIELPIKTTGDDSRSRTPRCFVCRRDVLRGRGDSEDEVNRVPDLLLVNVNSFVAFIKTHILFGAGYNRLRDDLARKAKHIQSSVNGSEFFSIAEITDEQLNMDVSFRATE